MYKILSFYKLHGPLLFDQKFRQSAAQAVFQTFWDAQTVLRKVWFRHLLENGWVFHSFISHVHSARFSGLTEGVLAKDFLTRTLVLVLPSVIKIVHGYVTTRCVETVKPLIN